jgi:hypothetical protein
MHPYQGRQDAHASDEYADRLPRALRLLFATVCVSNRAISTSYMRTPGGSGLTDGVADNRDDGSAMTSCTSAFQLPESSLHLILTI